MSDFPIAVPFVMVVSFLGRILKLDSIVDFRKQNCNISQFIYGFDMILGLSDLTVTLDDQEFVS